MKLSLTQKFALDHVADADLKHGKAALMEVGPYKPFNANTIRSLEQRGLIEITKSIYPPSGSIHYARLTENGKKAAHHAAR